MKSWVGKKLSLDEVIVINFPINKCITSLSNEYAKHFCDQTLHIVHDCDVIVSDHTNTFVGYSIFVEESSAPEVLNIFRMMNTNKSPGADGIRAIDLKAHALVFAPSLQKL